MGGCVLHLELLHKQLLLLFSLICCQIAQCFVFFFIDEVSRKENNSVWRRRYLSTCLPSDPGGKMLGKEGMVLDKVRVEIRSRIGLS